jgi:hypothetical protein
MKHRFIVEIDIPEGQTPNLNIDIGTTFTNTVFKTLKYGLLNLLKLPATVAQKNNIDNISHIVSSFKLIRTDEFDDTELQERY